MPLIMHEIQCKSSGYINQAFATDNVFQQQDATTLVLAHGQLWLLIDWQILDEFVKQVRKWAVANVVAQGRDAHPLPPNWIVKLFQVG